MQVTSRELSEKLKPYMKDVDNYFVWSREKIVIQPREGGKKRLEWTDWRVVPKYDTVPPFYEHVDCYTLDEILSRLPAEIEHNDIKYEWAVYKWGIGYVNRKLPRKLIESFFATSNGRANAAAQLLCWCGENGHLGGDDEINR